MSDIKNSLSNLVSALVGDVSDTRLPVLIDAIRQAKAALGQTSMAVVDVKAVLIASCAEVLIDHCMEQGYDGYAMDFSDNTDPGDHIAPHIAVSVDRDVTDAVRHLLEETLTPADSRVDDTEEDFVVNVPGSDSRWEN